MAKEKKAARGRPPKGEGTMLVALTVRLSEPMMDEIEAIAASRPLERPEKGQIIRELIAEALTARAKRK